MRLRYSLVMLALVSSGVAFGAQGDVEIVHDPIECWPVDRFLMVQSSFVPPEDIQTAKFYFRSTAHVDYYYVELTLGRDGGRAIAPKAEPATPGVSYYLELVTRGFSAFRTEERVVPVDSGTECRRRDPETAFYTGETPDIAVGATRGGVPQMPPGFQAEGISRFISATGIQGGPGGGGGVSGKTIGIIAGIGGAGAAALALSGGGSSETTTTVIGGVTTTTPSSSSTSTAIGGGGSTTTTTGGGGGGSTTTIVGSTSTIVGSTTTIVGSSTTTSVGTSSTTSIGTTTTTIGSSTTTTSVGSSTTTSSAPSSSTTSSIPPSSTTTSAASGADVQFSKRDSTDPVRVNQVFSYFLVVTNNGPGTATSVGLQDNLPNGMTAGFSTHPCSLGKTVICSLGNMAPRSSITVEIRVIPSQLGTFTNSGGAFGTGPDPNTSNNTDSEPTTVVSSLRTLTNEELPASFETTLELHRPEPGAIGRLVVNNVPLLDTRADAPQLHRFALRGEEAAVEAHVEPAGGADGFWLFDFTKSEAFVPGSIRVESGNVTSLTSHKLVFSLKGPSPLRFRARFQKAEKRPEP